MRRIACCGAIALVLTLPTASGGELIDERAPFHRGVQQVALLAGGGFGIPMFVNRNDRENRARIFGLFPRWAIGLSDPLQHGTLLEGNVELDVEPMLLLNFHPRSGWAGGGSLLLHYNFLGHGQFVPFIEGGGGASHLDFDLRDQSDGFTFPLQASVGIHGLVPTRGVQGVTASVGYYHLSNAGLRYPNTGINTVMIRVGLLFFPFGLER